MEKVKLTKDQAKELESFKILGHCLEDFVKRKSSPYEPFSVIDELNLDDLAKALYIGYEIEPEQPKFQPGDKVKFKNEIHTLDEPAKNPLHRDGSGGRAWRLKGTVGWLGENQIRHATPEEIYWLETLGREKVGDFKTRDVIVDDGNFLYEISNGSTTGDRIFSDDAIKWYLEGKIKGFYPAESFKSFLKESAE